MPDDRTAWTPWRCPVCHMLARARPARLDTRTIACPSCGEFCLSGAAEDIFDAASGPAGRERLSEVVQDACLLADREVPLIDTIAATVLMALAGMPLPRPLQGRRWRYDRPAAR